MHWLPGFLRRKRPPRPFDYYLRSILFRVILPTIAFSALLSFAYSYYQHYKIGNLVFEGVKRRIDILITESVKGFRKGTLHYEKDIMAMLQELGDRVEEGLSKGKDYSQINFQTIIKKYKGKFPAELFEGINYYIISKDGKIIWTDYEKDLGLDLSRFEDFWNSLNIALKSGPVLHRTGIEVMTGKMRIYAYRRLSNGDILEIGFLLNNKDFIDNLRKLRGLSIYLKEIGIYNVAYLSMLSDFPTFPKSPLRFHPYKRDVLGDIAIEDFPPYEQKMFVYARLNFYSTFKIVLFNTFLFGILFIVIALISFHVYLFFKRETS